MDIESSSSTKNTQNQQERSSSMISGVFAWLKGLPRNAKDKMVNVGKMTKKLGKDDPRRVIHSLKVGLALTLVSLLYYWRPLYDGFGVSGMWAVLTVVVVFEFSVGATLGKGLNRGFATLLAGALGVGALHLSSLFGRQGEPIVLGILVFLLAGAATFTRFIPSIKARYDYGVLIFILTFSMISVSGYRIENLLEMAHQRVSTILIGGATCIIVSIFICPVWAGQDLHNLIASNIDKLANFLEGFGGEYFEASSEEEEDCETETKTDKSFLHGYKSVLNTKANEETLANFAKWEPGHGRFLFRHPWKQYLKIGGLARQCAYHIEALTSHLTSETQTSEEFNRMIQDSCTKMSSESGKALKSLATSIKTMKHPKLADEHVENAKIAIEDLKASLEAAAIENFDLLAIVSGATVSSILCEIVECVEKLSSAVHELSQMAQFKKNETVQSSFLHRGTVKPVFDSEIEIDAKNNNKINNNKDHVTITIHDIITNSSETKVIDVPKPREGIVNIC